MNDVKRKVNNHLRWLSVRSNNFSADEMPDAVSPYTCPPTELDKKSIRLRVLTYRYCDMKVPKWIVCKSYFNKTYHVLCRNQRGYCFFSRSSSRDRIRSYTIHLVPTLLHRNGIRKVRHSHVTSSYSLWWFLPRDFESALRARSMWNIAHWITIALRKTRRE